ncbi:MAG: tyrosine-protein phosphatase [Acidimicrobiales bacterium]
MTGSISHANVTRAGHDLLLTWRGGGDDTSVFVSDDPDDAGVDVRAPDAPGRLLVPAAGADRLYFHLFDPDTGFVVTAERRIDLDGPVNFRDIGGHPVDGGAWIRWGRVYRADSLASLTDADQERLVDLGVGHVFDLRTDVEVRRAPDRLPAEIAYERLAMSSDGRGRRTLLQRIGDGELTAFSEADMVAGYVRMLESFGPSVIRRIVARVADGGAIVVHCTAGKDRTGLVAMVLLALAGADDGHILDDYELSARHRPPDPPEALVAEIERVGLDPRRFESMWASPRSVMRATLERVRSRWGSVAGYLVEIGVDDQLRRQAHRSLVSGR